VVRRTANPPSRTSLRRAPPPTATRGKTVRGLRTRNKLIRAAEKVFGNVGFYEARISEITREAGVAAGTFYLYFQSKEELLRALIQAINRDLRRTLSAGTNHLRTRADAEARGFEIFFYEFLPRHRKLYRIIKQAEFADPPIFEWYYRHLADGYARRLRAAMDGGEFRPWDPDLAACALMGIADFVAMRYVTWGRGLPRDKLEELMEFILAGLVAPNGQSAPKGTTALKGAPVLPLLPRPSR
jgi:AcrR family transcriptional regulator